MSEEEKIKKFDEEQLEILLNDLQDIDKFTRFKNGTFKYELGKYQANLLVNHIKKYKEVIDRLNKLAGIRLLTMYFEDGGEISVLPYEDLLDILEEVE